MKQYKTIIGTLVSLSILGFGVTSEAKVSSSKPSSSLVGVATFYDDMFQGRPTATGERFTQKGMTAAAPAGYPFGSVWRITNLRNHKSVHVRVNDRGRLGKNHFDLTKHAALQLGMLSAGRVKVKIERVQKGVS